MSVSNALLSARDIALAYAAVLLCGLAAFAVFATWHLSSTGFWYDESMQFWMSLGIDGFGPPRVVQGSLKDMVNANALANLDPGGFTLIARYWLRAGTSEIWQRVLPLLFFVVAMAGLGWTGWNRRKSVLFAILCSSVFAAFPLVLDYATEFRAYTMEIAGLVIGTILIERLAARPDWRLAWFTGTIFSVFLGSRYSFVLFTGAACLALAYAFGRRSQVSLRTKFGWLLAFATPVAIACAIIVVLALWPQYQARISYDNGALVQYLSGTTAAGKSPGEIGAMLAANLLHPLALPLTASALIGLIAVLPRSWFRLDDIKAGIEKLDLGVFGVMCLASLVLSALLWRWHPWTFTLKWSLWLQALSAIAIVRLCAAALQMFAEPHAAGSPEPRKLATLMLLALLALDLRFALYRRPDWPTFVPALAYLEKVSPPPGSVSMDVHSYPTIRYFYEYGAFAGSKLFPQTFRMPHWSAPTPLIHAQSRYLITGMNLADANRVFAPARIIADLGLPNRLFRVELPQ